MEINAKELRVEKGLTQVELSEAIGISQSEISMLENKKIGWTAKTAKRYGDYFEFDWHYIF